MFGNIVIYILQVKVILHNRPKLECTYLENSLIHSKVKCRNLLPCLSELLIVKKLNYVFIIIEAEC